jgi:hypothetical protein
LGSTTDETREASGSAAGVLAGTTVVGTAPEDATTAGVVTAAAAGVDDGARRDETSGRIAAAELDAGSGVEAGIMVSGTDPVDAAGTTAATLDSTPKGSEDDVAAGTTAATLESTPKGSEDDVAAGTTAATLESTPKGSEDVAAAGTTAATLAATLESTPKGSEDVAAAAGGAEVETLGIASGLVMGADATTADDVELPKPSAPMRAAAGSAAALEVEATTSGDVPLVTI